ncbi:MAG: DsbA family protein, partial [Planctomycetota bacterium]
CWGFDPVLRELVSSLPEGVAVRRLLGGLAPDSDEPMPAGMREYVQGQWRLIQQRIPGTRFDFGFWGRCLPHRSTYPACRAVIAARRQGERHDEAMTRAVQRAYYTEARNPSDIATLIELAGEIGVDQEDFRVDLASEETDRELRREIAECRSLGIEGFPSLLVIDGGSRLPVPIDYIDPAPMLRLIRERVAGP